MTALFEEHAELLVKEGGSAENGMSVHATFTSGPTANVVAFPSRQPSVPLLKPIPIPVDVFGIAKDLGCSTPRFIDVSVYRNPPLKNNTLNLCLTVASVKDMYVFVFGGKHRLTIFKEEKHGETVAESQWMEGGASLAIPVRELARPVERRSLSLGVEVEVVDNGPAKEVMVVCMYN